MKIRRRQPAGFTLVEILIVLALLGLLIAVAVPNFVRIRSSARKNVCIENLHQIDQAMQQWALEQKKAATAAVTFNDISAYMKCAVVCPAGGTAFADSYSISTVSTMPSCQKNPFSHLLSGFPLAGTTGNSGGGPGLANSGSNGHSGGNGQDNGPGRNGPPGHTGENPRRGHGP